MRERRGEDGLLNARPVPESKALFYMYLCGGQIAADDERTVSGQQENGKRLKQKRVGGSAVLRALPFSFFPFPFSHATR